MISLRTNALMAIVAAAPPLLANTLTDVGVGLAPEYDPARGTEWTLSSSCVDINENGEAACQTRADGPSYRCGFRGIKRCSSKLYQVQQWDGQALQLVSAPTEGYSVPLVINNVGQIGGYAYEGAVYPRGGGNGRIWQQGQAPLSKANPVISLNDAGDYILQNGTAPSGYMVYQNEAFHADDTPIPVAGLDVRPMVINNDGITAGGQIIQRFVHELSAPGGNEIPEVSGVGWLLDQNEIDDLPLDPGGLYDVDGQILWQSRYYRISALANYETRVTDINEHGDILIHNRFGGLFSSALCSREGESVITDVFGARHRVPWRCVGSDYTRGTFAGGKAFTGLNNIGDAVGVFTPGAYSYSSSYTSHPWVWLRNTNGGWDEYDANDLLPADSDYTIVSVSDINDSRQIVGNCLTAAGERRGCILHVTDPAFPDDTVQPGLRIDFPRKNAVVTDKVRIRASAWDSDSRIRKVIFKVNNKRIGVDRTRPFARTWKTAGYAPGSYRIKLVAIDNAGNRKMRKVVVSLAGGTPVEGKGVITALGKGFIEVAGQRLFINENTSIFYNDVNNYTVGMSVQYRGVQLADEKITLNFLEVN